MKKEFIYKNTKISFTDTGKGNALVLLHGFLENHSMWNAFIPELSKRNRVITIDLLGHGESECTGYIHTMEEMAEHVYAVLKSLRLRKVSLVGHSMGGYVCLAFAEAHPQMTRKVMLLNSTAKADDAERKLNRDRAVKAVQTNRETFIQIAIPNLFSETNRARFQNEINTITNEALKTPLQGVIAAIEGMKVRKDRMSLIENPELPVTIVIGQNDPVLDYPAFKQIQFGPNVFVIELPDGHMSHIENTEEVAEILAEFATLK